MLEIQRWISDYNYSNGRDSYKYIVLHWTGNETDTAKGNANYFNGGNRNASAHYFVDNNSIYQVVEDYNTAWHVGDNKGYSDIKNRNSIGIEMCGTNGDISEQTIVNTLELVKYLMNKYGIDIDHIVSHNMASGKICPEVWSYNNWAKWYDFKDRLAKGSEPTGEWISQDGKWWYRFSDGSYAKDQWLKIKNKWYLFDESGWMLYDWKSDDGKWYYLGQNNDGALKTGWLLKDSKWYYLDESGIMAIGWKQISGDWYYFNTSGEMLVNWFKDDKGNDYMAYSTGQLVTNCQYANYSFDKDGHPTKL